MNKENNYRVIGFPRMDHSVGKLKSFYKILNFFSDDFSQVCNINILHLTDNY